MTTLIKCKRVHLGMKKLIPITFHIDATSQACHEVYKAAVTYSIGKLELLKSLRAMLAIDYSNEDIDDVLKKFDAVADGPGEMGMSIVYQNDNRL